jgi:hypothetical protein
MRHRTGQRKHAGKWLMTWRVAACAVVAAAAIQWPGAAGAAAATAGCEGWAGAQPQSPGSETNILEAVAVLSPCNAWAVGYSFTTGASGNQNLIEHWNGATWKAVTSPDPGANNYLLSVRAVSARNIWAVGGTDNKTSILHYDGTAWKPVTSPNPGTTNELRGVRAVSASNIWAVGYQATGSKNSGLIVHYDGHTWRTVHSPAPGTDSSLAAVAATSARDVWAVGNFASSSGSIRTLIEHWNGTRWRQVSSPSPAPDNNNLEGVGATSARDAWAVGTFVTTAHRTLILHWNGRKWARVASPNPEGDSGRDSFLLSVTATSRGHAWAVGGTGLAGADRDLILRWNGRRWVTVGAPILASNSYLAGVGAGSAGDAWAVGTASSVAVALHCC